MNKRGLKHMDFEAKKSILEDIQRLKKMVEKLELEVSDIPAVEGDLYYSPAVMQIDHIVSELGIMRNTLKELQDSESNYTEFP